MLKKAPSAMAPNAMELAMKKSTKCLVSLLRLTNKITTNLSSGKSDMPPGRTRTGQKFPHLIKITMTPMIQKRNRRIVTVRRLDPSVSGTMPVGVFFL